MSPIGGVPFQAEVTRHMKPDPLSPKPMTSDSPGLATALLREGWAPHRFANSDIVVILPQARIAKFGENGTLYASFSRDNKIDFTATLHTNPRFINQRELALEFVSQLSKKKNATAVDLATYRYFADPNVGIEKSRENNFWVIGIPGAVVVISLTRDAGAAFAPDLERIRAAIPAIVGELL
jgi:hypothetical protein